MVLIRSGWALGLLGVLALVAITPLGQVIAVIGMISVIGLPIAILVMALPGLFLVVLACRLVWQAWGSYRTGHRRKALAFALAFLVMADVFVFRAWRVNAWLEGTVGSLVEQDEDALAEAGPVGTLAVLRTVRGSFDADTHCDDLCRRLLLTGSARRVLALTLQAKVKPGEASAWPWPARQPGDDLPGMAWRLERRGSCPDPAPPTSQRVLTLPEPAGPRGTSIVAPVSTEQLIRLAIADGHCLIGEPASLGVADAMLAYGTVHEAASTFPAGYEAWTDTVGAWRLGYWTRREGALVQTYQRTGVRWQRLPGALIPWLEDGSELRTAHGWARVAAWRNRSRFEGEPPVGLFVTERLGLDLRPAAAPGSAGTTTSQASLRSGQARVVDRVLATEGEPTQTEMRVVVDYLDAIGSPFVQRVNGADPGDAARVLRLLQDGRVALPGSAAGAVRFAATSDPALAGPLAAALASRLAQVPPPPSDSRARKAWNTTVRATTAALAQLPAEAVGPHRALAVELMRDRERRVMATTFLGRLDLFGPAIVPDVLAMMDDAAGLRDARVREVARLRSSWSEVWRAGVLSLCRLAPQIPDTLGDLRSRASTLAVSKVHPADELVAAAMLRMGAGEDDLRRTLSVGPDTDDSRRSFSATLRRAQRNDACR